MGCFFNKSKEDDSVSGRIIDKKEYSWDKRREINVEDFTIENLENQEKWKVSGTINGEQVVIQNCRNSTIYILDHLNTITIDDCVGCKIVLGPVKGSAFLRDCRDCVCLVACGQFRIRDCRNMVVFLSCATQPIIESSSSILVGCYQLFYSGIKEHFKKAGLSVFNNTWSRIHDFTPVVGESNWGLLPENTTPQNYISCEDYTGTGITLNLTESIVPYTTAVKMTEGVEHCFVVFFFNGGEEEVAARSLIDRIYLERVDCRLVWSRQVVLEPQEAVNIFLSDSCSRSAKLGPVIGLLFSGSCINYSCKQIIGEKGSSDLVYISDTPSLLKHQVSSFLSITDMHIAF